MRAVWVIVSSDVDLHFGTVSPFLSVLMSIAHSYLRFSASIRYPSNVSHFRNALFHVLDPYLSKYFYKWV